MRLLDAEDVPDYLRSCGRIAPEVKVRVELLSGGVSNVVLRVEPDVADPGGAKPFVIKQARERLRTEVPWFSRLDRIWRETAVMSAIQPLLPAGAVPRILFEDRENYLFAMEAVDRRHVVWKQELLAGQIRPEVAVRLAEYLAAIHVGTHRKPEIEREFDDREVFVQLRVDPFYRHIAGVHPELRAAIDGLVDEMWQTRVCLVHADFSPKNVLLVDSSRGHAGLQVTLVDFETGHYGDPAFDLGFFLSHLVLKGVRVGTEIDSFLQLAAMFWARYLSEIVSLNDDPAFEPAALERRTVANLAGCALARVDGTSPVDYLRHSGQRELVRQLCSRVFLDRIEDLAAVHALATTLVQHEG
jgi:aminoglycoside phosphotransferase (APT) family kinase protein